MRLLVSLLFGLLLLLASLHKISRPMQFRGILAAYRLLPERLLGLAAKIIPLIELSLGLAWLSGIEHNIVVVGTSGLLALYAAAMAINIALGNISIIFLICMNFSKFSCNIAKIRNICPVFYAKNMTFPN